MRYCELVVEISKWDENQYQDYILYISNIIIKGTLDDFAQTHKKTIFKKVNILGTLFFIFKQILNLVFILGQLVIISLI